MSVVTRAVVATLSMLALSASAPDARADAVEDFFKGKTITYYISTVPGGGYDLYGRFTATYMGRHIDRKSTRLNSSHTDISRMPSSA